MWASDGYRDFPSGPMIKTLSSKTGGVGSIPGQESKFPHALQPKKKKKTHSIKQKQYCNKFNKYFKNHPHQKKKSKWNEVTLKLP